LLITVCSVLTMLGIVGLSALNAEPAGGGLPDAPARVVVQTGDTLWQIAAEVAPAEDPAAVVQLLRSANDLDSAPLQAGQVLVIPRR
jgi:LysM repeat protein